VVSKFPDVQKTALEKLQELYFTRERVMSNPDSSVETRKKYLIAKANARTITKAEGDEVRVLLEKQRQQHQAKGDFTGVLLAGLLLAIILGVIASLFDDSE